MRSAQVAAAVLLFSLGSAFAPTPLLAQVNCGPSGAGVRVGVAPPPPLPQYAQPPIPAYGDVWTPGYWGWNGAVNDYYWVPGLWVAPPAIGLFWTPGYWGWGGGVFVFNAGYWGPHVGFYGGINYGFGYWGRGYDGGFWRGRTFFYNRRYNNFGALRVNAVYDRRVAGDRFVGRVSYSGGPGGVKASPTASELAAAHEAHVSATASQTQHTQDSAADSRLRAGPNPGHPASSPSRSHGVSHGTQSHGSARGMHHAGSMHHTGSAHASHAYHHAAMHGPSHSGGAMRGNPAHGPSGGGHAFHGPHNGRP